MQGQIKYKKEKPKITKIKYWTVITYKSGEGRSELKSPKFLWNNIREQGLAISFL